MEGERSGLFFEILRIADETKAPFIFLENVTNIRTKGAERVCKELAERGYDCRWCNISASDVGALHKRERWFLLAYSDDSKRGQQKPRGISKEASETASEWEDDNTPGVTSGTSQIRRAREGYLAHTQREGGGGDEVDGGTPDRPASIQSKDGETLTDNVEPSREDASNAKSQECAGLSGREAEEQPTARICGKYSTVDEWQEAQSEFCGIFNDVSKRLDEIKGDKIDETLRILWERNDSTEMVKRKIRFYFQKSEVLFKEMLRRLDSFIEKCETIKRKKTSTKEDEIDSLCKLWTDKELTKTSCRQESVEQQSRELNSAMSNLSQERTHKRYDLGKMWNEEDTFEYTTKETKNRASRVKALGNAVVPLQVREAFKMLIGIE